MSAEYNGFYLVHKADIADLTTEQLWQEIEEYERRCESAKDGGYGISSKEFVRNRLCRAEVYRRTWGDIPEERVRAFFQKA